jgi:ubiquitin carboxyl-terminal hydrolase 3
MYCACTLSDFDGIAIIGEKLSFYFGKVFNFFLKFRTKIDLRIKFPIQALDLTGFILNSGPETRRSNSHSIYDLAAVIVHHGSGTSNGHYTAYACNGGTWMHFNDSSVKEVNEQIVADCKPYILFYTKRDGDNPYVSSASSSTSSDSSP